MLPMGQNWVGDLLLEATVTSHSAQGHSALDLVRAGRHFQCAIDLALGQSAAQARSTGPTSPAAQTAAARPGQASLWCLPTSIGNCCCGSMAASCIRRRHGLPDGRRRRSQPRRSGSRPASARAAPRSRSSTWCSSATCITSPPAGRVTTASSTITIPAISRMNFFNFFAEPDLWTGDSLFAHRQEVTFPLEADQFFVLGDNSPASKDSRLWSQDGLEYYVDAQAVDRQGPVHLLAAFVPSAAAGFRLPIRDSVPVLPELQRHGIRALAPARRRSVAATADVQPDSDAAIAGQEDHRHADPRSQRTGQNLRPAARRRWRRFQVERGEIVGLLGPNGAGKTTSFRMTCGMIEPDAGKVMLNDVDVTLWPMYRRARDGGMGYLAQESSVFRKLSVENNLLGVMEMLGIDRKTRAAPLRRTARPVRYRPAAQVAGHVALGRRTAAAGNRPLPGLESQDDPARRAVHRHRSGDDRQHPADHPRPAHDGHLDPDHRPPGARDAARSPTAATSSAAARCSATAGRTKCSTNPEARKYYFGEGIDKIMDIPAA